MGGEETEEWKQRGSRGEEAGEGKRRRESRREEAAERRGRKEERREEEWDRRKPTLPTLHVQCWGQNLRQCTSEMLPVDPHMALLAFERSRAHLPPRPPVFNVELVVGGGTSHGKKVASQH